MKNGNGIAAVFVYHGIGGASDPRYAQGVGKAAYKRRLSDPHLSAQGDAGTPRVRRKKLLGKGPARRLGLFGGVGGDRLLHIISFFWCIGAERRP